MPVGAILLRLVVGITDGDTLAAKCDGVQEQVKVRLAEIDAPEKKQRDGKQ
jgi:endonuclease YncB( thermonuclease family)